MASLPVVDGLALNPIAARGLPKGSRIVAATPELDLDLQGLNVIQDERFHKLVSQLTQNWESVL